MARSSQEKNYRTAPVFDGQPKSVAQNLIPSSSPAFGTPVHQIRKTTTSKPSVLSIIIPPATLRPIAFRIFTKKYSLTLNSSALQALSTFIGQHCGTDWRESGLAEPVLEDVAKSWKNVNSNVIVDGEAKDLKEILKNLEGFMVGGKIAPSRELSRQNSLVAESPQQSDKVLNNRFGIQPSLAGKDINSFNQVFPGLGVDEKDDIDMHQDPRNWLKVIDAFELPRLVYDVGKKHFDRLEDIFSLFIFHPSKTENFEEILKSRVYFRLLHTKLSSFEIGII